MTTVRATFRRTWVVEDTTGGKTSSSKEFRVNVNVNVNVVLRRNRYDISKKES